MEMKLKDWVTLGNLVCGMSSIGCLVVPEFNFWGITNFDMACYLVVFGYLFDAADGLVARLTKQFNKFGGELDNLCDMITYSIAPGMLIFHAFLYQAEFHPAAAAFIGLFPVAVGTIRAARFNVRRAEFPGFFIGLPRTAFALIIVAVLNSSVFQALGPQVSKWLYFIPILIILYTSALMISLRGFVSHHAFKWKGVIRFGIWFFLLSIPVGLIGGWLLDFKSLLFDFLLFDLIIYIFVANLYVPKQLKEDYSKYIETWKAMGQ